MVTPLDLRRQYGDVETVSLARILLRPVARKLSGNPLNIDRHSVIGHYLDFFIYPDGVRDDLALDDVRDDLAPFGAIEAVAVCKRLHMAVIVFWAEASVKIALQRQEEIPSPGWLTAIPPLDAANPLSFPPHLIEAEMYPPTPATGTPRRPLFWFRNSPHDTVMVPPRGNPGTTWFTPSRIHEPVLGADGHLWMEGLNVLHQADGNVVFRVERSWIRVAQLDPQGGDDPPTFVPLFSTAATLTSVPQTGRPYPAATAMVTLDNLREQHGDVVETATIARDLLAPVASQLSGDPSNLHRRCVLGRYLNASCHPDTVRDNLAPFGAIEAVAVCKCVYMAVVVFWAEASVAVMLGRQGETSYGWFTAVPPLDEALLPLCFVPPSGIQVSLYPQTPAMTTLAPPRPLRCPCFVFRNSPHELAMIRLRRDAGTTWFKPSRNSRVYGPVIREDGHLWMNGHDVLCCEGGAREDPSWVRVTLFNAPGIYYGDPPIFVPLLSID